MVNLFKRYLPRYKFQIAAVCVITIAQSFVHLFLLMGEMKKILDRGVPDGDMNFISGSAARMILYALFLGLCAAAVSYLGTYVAAGIKKDLCRDCYRKVLSMKPQDFSAFGESTLFTRCISDSDIIQKLIGTALKTCILVPAVIIALFFSLFTIDRQIFAVELITVLIAALIMAGIWVYTRPAFRDLQIMTDRLTLLFREKIVGVRTIRAFGNQEYELKRTIEAADRFRNLDIRANAPLKLMTPSVMIIVNLSIVAVFFFGSEQVRSGMSSVSTLILVIQYINYLIPCLCVMPILINMLPASAASSERIMELMDYELIDDRTESPEGNDSMPGKNTAVSFNSVCFGYNSSKNVLSDITFDVMKGEKVAIIGTTGSGKSTILNVMMGFNRLTGGTIRINGVDAQKMDRTERVGIFSYAPQKASVFQDTVIENIRAYHDDITKEAVDRACVNSGFDEVLDKLESGLDTMMAQGGMNLSGGQRKRLSLARALAREAQIYLLDDPFAALDARTEAVVSKRTMEQLKDKTVIMVAQKISSIAGFDKILVLKDGCLDAVGTHAELLAGNEEYREIYDTQCYLERES